MSKVSTSLIFLSSLTITTNVLATDESEYVLSVGKKGLPRLEMQDELLEPHTDTHLLMAGLSGKEGQPKIVYDLGCGPGLVTIKLAQRAHHVYAIDTKPDQLALAKDRVAAAGLNNVTFILGDIRFLKDLPEEGNVDVVYIRCVLAHVNDPEKIINVTKRLLKNGGVVASQEPILGTFWEPSQNLIFCEWRKAAADVAEKLGNNYNIGKHLKPLYDKEGFKVDNLYFVQQTMDLPTTKKLFLLDIDEWPAKAIDLGVLTQEKVDNWRRAIQALSDESDFSLATFAFLVGKKG